MVLLVVLAATAAIPLTLTMSPSVSAYTPHPPIYVNDNGDFTPPGAGAGCECVTGGTGTSADPYLIEGWEVDAGSSHGIEVEDTNAYFVVRDVHVHNASDYSYPLSGIFFSNVTNGALENALVTENAVGVSVVASRDVWIARSNLSANAGGYDPFGSASTGIGLVISGSSNVTASDNVIRNNEGSDFSMDGGHGVVVTSSSSVDLVGNLVISNSGTGISVGQSTDVRIEGNEIANNLLGVTLGSVVGATVVGNHLTANGITLGGNQLAHFNSHDIAIDNLVNGDPVRYYKNCSGVTLDALPTGQLLVVNCANVRAANFVTGNTDLGAFVAYSNNLLLEDLDMQPNAGLAPYTSNLPHRGISVLQSSDVTISRVTIERGTNGLYMEYVSRAIVSDSTFLENDGGMAFFWSNNVTVVGSTVATTYEWQRGSGIHPFRSADIVIEGNVISRSGENIYLQDSNRIVVRCNDLEGGHLGAGRDGEGVRLWVNNDVTIIGNTLKNHSIGVRAFDWNYGIIAHHNNLIGSTYAQAQDAVGNTWDDGYPSGGNHWSDYSGSDLYSGPNQDQPGNDGIGDTPYVIPSSGLDRYPLMGPTTCPAPDHPPSRPVLLSAALTGSSGQDATLAWQLSADDGAGENDVVAYEVWSANSYDPARTGYTLMATVPAGTSTFVHVGGSVGDSGNYFYFVRAVDVSGQSADSRDQGAKLAIWLAAGRNLISVPTIQSSWDINVVLETLPWTKARTYVNPSGQGKNWLSNAREKPWADLTTVDARMALWVDLSAPAWWTTAGLVPSSVQLTLVTGWNFVGYPSFVPRTVAEVLAGLNYQKVQGFATNPPHFLQTLPSSAVMAAGNGYWVHVSEDAVLTLGN